MSSFFLFLFSTNFSKLPGWSPRDTPGGIKLDDVSLFPSNNFLHQLLALKRILVNNNC